MFDKNKFAQILKNISETYESQREFAKKSGINRTYLSQYINMKLNKPPKPKTLEKLANSSRGIVSYDTLMLICGYINYPSDTDKIQIVASYVSNKNYVDLKNTINKLFKLNLTNEELKNISIQFSSCCQDILDNYNNNIVTTKLSDYKNNLSVKERKGFNCLYISLLRKLHRFANVPRKKNEVFSIKKHLILKDNVDDINQCLNIIRGMKDYYSLKINEYINSNINTKYYMCPVYGQISAGTPNWVEECIEGRLPIDPELMGIVNPEEHFFLRVNGESMNKIIKNGAFALIHKQDMVEDGEIAVVLVNGYDATLKKFTRQGNMIILEPQSNDDSFKTQVYDKTTPIKILGKYVGKMEINK